MSAASDRAAIEGRWRDLWVTGDPPQPRTPTAWANGPFDPAPNPYQPLNPPADQPWARLDLGRRHAEQVSLGSVGVDAVRIRTSGEIAIAISVPLLAGRGPALELADAAQSLFAFTRFGTVTCRDATVTPRGPDGPWFRVDVTIAFISDDLA